MLKSTREESCRRLSDTVRTGNQNFFFQNAPALLFPAGTQMCRQQQKRHPFGCLFAVGARNGTFSRGRTRQWRYRSVRPALTPHRGVIHYRPLQVPRILILKGHPFGCPFVVGARNGTFSRGRTRQWRCRSVRSALTPHRGVIHYRPLQVPRILILKGHPFGCPFVVGARNGT